MDTKSMWAEICYASGLETGNEGYQHDLLDGIGPKDAPLDQAFAALCRAWSVTNWEGAERVIAHMRTCPGLEGLRLPDQAVDWLCNRTDEAAGIGKIHGIAHHTSIRRGTYQSTWGTPAWVIGLVIDACGHIDLDLASNAEAQKIVQAKRYYSIEDPCPLEPPVSAGEVVYCNPPGPSSGTKEFWAAWLSCLKRGARGAYLFFNIDHARQIEKLYDQALPVIMLRKRLRFVGAKQGATFPSALVFSPGVTVPTGHGSILLWQP